VGHEIQVLVGDLFKAEAGLVNEFKKLIRAEEGNNFVHLSLPPVL
jgi:hypothetical protein